MLLVPRINALRRISGKEIAVKDKTGRSFQDGNAFILRYAGTDSRFIDHDIAPAQGLSHRLAGRIQRGQIGTVMQVDRRRDRHNIIVTPAELFRIGRTEQPRLAYFRQSRQQHGLQQFARHLLRRITPFHQGGHPFPLHIIPDHRITRRKQPRQRQTDISEADNGKFYIFHPILFVLFTIVFPYLINQTLTGGTELTGEKLFRTEQFFIIRILPHIRASPFPVYFTHTARFRIFL